MSVFGKNNGRSNRVKRNVFDLSFQNNLTTKFGQLTPCFCKEVLPGDSFKIDTTFGLRFMPTYFPLQTKIRADIHFFYVRNRNLWRDWMDFIGNTKTGLIPPYRNSYVETGSLGDYLGIPTIKKGYTFPPNPSGTSDYLWIDTSIPISDTLLSSCSPNPGITQLFHGSSNFPAFFLLPSTNRWLEFNDENCPAVDILNIPSGYATNFFDSEGQFLVPFTTSVPKISGPFRTYIPFFINCYDSNLKCNLNHYIDCDLVVFDLDSKTVVKTLAHSKIEGNQHNLQYVFLDVNETLSPSSRTIFALRWNISGTIVCFSGPRISSPVSRISYTFGTQISGTAEASDYKDVNLSALPFRAYESIYNSFYRDDRNNPRLVDGEPVYNEYLRSKDGGRDVLDYPLYFRNWEQDYLSTAVPTPQQGNAPLVGISSTGQMTFEYEGREYTAQAQTADDNDTIVSAKFSENVPGSVARSLVDLVTSGISINDFRNVNAFQRWKETNLRRGMKYKDQIKSHYDVDVSYSELDMPEFIGGVSIPVTPNTVTATAETGDVSIGDYRGQLYGTGSSKHSVSQYFDEHGFVIGILSVVPVPVYSQLLPKFFLKSNPLDYYFPEFGHIGFQPISNNEVNMLAVQNKKDPGTFGYQRPWYDYLGSVDETHGQFRTTLSDFVLSRVFDGVPNLGHDFTVIKPDDLNHVFTETSDNDKILGQIYFNVSAKRPIPLYGVPRLEADI